MSGREPNPGTELADRFRAMNVPVLGGDFADWCRANGVGIGGIVEITWSAGKMGVGNTVAFRVTAIGERKILAVRTDEDYGETLLYAEGHPIHGIRKLTEGSAAPPSGVDREALELVEYLNMAARVAAGKSHQAGDAWGELEEMLARAAGRLRVASCDALRRAFREGWEVAAGIDFDFIDPENYETAFLEHWQESETRRALPEAKPPASPIDTVDRAEVLAILSRAALELSPDMTEAATIADCIVLIRDLPEAKL